MIRTITIQPAWGRWVPDVLLRDGTVALFAMGNANDNYDDYRDQAEQGARIISELLENMSEVREIVRLFALTLGKKQSAAQRISLQQQMNDLAACISDPRARL